MHGVKETSTEVPESVWVVCLPAFLQTITVTLNFQDICYANKHPSNKTSGVERYFLNLGWIIFFKYYKLQAVESPKKVLVFPESQTQISPEHFSAKIKLWKEFFERWLQTRRDRVFNKYDLFFSRMIIGMSFDRDGKFLSGLWAQQFGTGGSYEKYVK